MRPLLLPRLMRAAALQCAIGLPVLWLVSIDPRGPCGGFSMLFLGLQWPGLVAAAILSGGALTKEVLVFAFLTNLGLLMEWAVRNALREREGLALTRLRER